MDFAIGVRRAARRLGVWLFVSLLTPLAAQAALTVTPLTWGVIGLDSNSPTAGPKNFPVGERICSNVATTNVTATMLFDSANPNVDFRAGSLSTLNFPSIAANACVDAYFEVSVNQVAAAYDTTRRFHVTASDGSGTYSSPLPRELYVEHLISQSRNSITNVRYGTNPASLTAVAAGGALNLVVGNTYTIELDGGTATQGYEQFEAFINFSNAVFQILSVNTSYSADNSTNVPNPNDKLYADACVWEPDPNSPNYRSCVGVDAKAGGSNVVTTYTVKIISGGGTQQTLNTLLYDFSGSSFHYNGDYSVGARVANIIDPSTANISKAFSPNPAPVNGVSTLTITLTNPNGGALSGYNFTDPLPAGMVIATPSGASTAGCGTPSLTASAGANSIAFSNGTVAGLGSCVINVNVTTSATGTYNNTTGHLFIDTLDTGHTGSASLVVSNAPPPGTGLCGQALATWRFPTGFNINNPAATSSSVSVSSAIGAGMVAFSETTLTADGTAAWGSNGSITTGAFATTNNEYFEFSINTTGLTSVSLAFNASFKTPNGPKGIAIYQGLSNTRPETGTSVFNNAAAMSSAGTVVPFTQNFTTGLNASGTTYFRIYYFNSGNTNNGSDAVLDDVVFTGCGAGTPATIAKTFAPNPIAINGVSTLSFALTNPNGTALTGAAFTDALPSSMQVAATPAAATTCGGTWAPTAGATSLTFSGGTIPASGSCSVSVNVTSNSAGPHSNVSGFLSTNETGTNTASVGTATLTVLSPPQIAKNFNPSPILAGGVSHLVFTVTNPNPNDTIAGVAFADTLPLAPGAMKVAATPNASTTGCGAPTFAPAPGAASLAFSNGTIGPGGSCTVSVDVTAPTTGTYNNTSGQVSFVINAQTITGNTASASLTVNPPHPAIGLLKQVGPSPTGPWLDYTAEVLPGNVYYQFTIENDGDVPLSPVTLNDPLINTSSCVPPASLPVAVAANNNHIFSCVVGPVAASAGLHPNTATASGTGGGSTVNDTSSASYASASMSLAKSVTETTFSAAGDVLHYSYLVTNTGSATLDGPITVADNRTTVTCPALSTIGNNDNFFNPGEQLTCTATYTVTAADVAAAQVTNTAQATNGTVDSNTDSRTVPLAASADVYLTKTLNTAGPYTVGQVLTFTIVVGNNGPSTATSVQVTDTPTNLTITNVSGAGCAALPCTLASLASGASVTITVTATIAGAGTFDNSATATGAQPDPDPSNNTDNTGNGGVTGASADVSVDKNLITAGPYLVGQTVTYTLLVANAGPSPATNIQVTDSPTNLSITGVSGSGCSTLPCTIPSLAVGANTTITVTALIQNAGAFDNSSTVSATEPDPDLSNNTDNTGNGGTAAPVADVQLSKTLSTGGPYTVGQTLTYSIVVFNAGPSTATGVTVVDSPTNLTLQSVSGGGCSALPCTLGTLASGASVTLTVTAKINAAGAFDNSATVSANEFDPNLSNNTDSTGNGGTAAASADVSIDKTLVTTGPYTVGQTLTFTLVVANAGPSVATNVQVTDTPTNLTIVGVSGAGCSALPCTIPSLAVGANVTITTTATINAAGAFDNSASVSATEPDPNLSNNTDNTGNGGSAGASADVSIDKSLVTTGPYTVGQTLTFTLLVANAGPSPATNVQVTDTPTNLTIVGVSGGGCSALPCTIPSLAVGANVTITTTATINAAGAFDNSASVSATEPDPNLSNNIDNTGNGGTAGAPQLSVTKSASPSTFTVGLPASYSVTVSNTGAAATSGNISLSDNLPSGITLVSSSGANWSCSGTTALNCTFSGTLAAGANTVLTLNVAVAASATSGDNTAQALGGGDPACPAAPNCSGTVKVGVTAPVLTTTKSGTLDNTVVAPSNQSNPGDTIAYTITVANSGTGSASAVNVTDPLLPTLACSIGGSGVSLPTTLAAGASLVCTGTYTLTAGDVSNGSVANTATTSGGNVCNPTTAGSTCSASTSTPLALAPVLTTTKTGVLDNTVVAPNNQSDAGDQIHYTITVANSGNGAATGVTISDAKLPSLSCTIGASTVTLPATIPAGATLTCTGTYTLTAGDIGAGSVTNTATVTGTNACTAAAPNCTGTEITPLGQVPILSLTKSATPNPFVVGQPASYTITVANNGTAASSANITVADTLPSGITLAGTAGANWSCTGTTTLSCTFSGTIAAGANSVLTLNVNVAASATTGDNSATASGGGDPTCPAAARCTGTVPVPITAPQLTVGKTATPNPFVVGQPASYTVTVTNSGSAATVGNITLSDALPSGITFVSASGANWSCSGTTTLSCTFAGTLAVSASTALTLNVSVGASAANGNNSATASGGGDPSCPATARCTGTVTVPVNAPLLNVTKTASPNPFVVGQPASYTITVANGGSAATSGNISVSDNLPSGITLASATGTNWACVGTTALTCTFSGTLAVGANTALTLNVSVGASVTSATNSATASGGGDPSCPAAAHCTGTVVVGSSVPQLDVTKTATPNPFVVGQPASYTITVTNSGSAATVGNIALSDNLPSGITLSSASGTNWACTGTSALTCTFSGTLAMGASTALTLNVAVGASATSGTNSATASGGGDPTCPAAPHCTGTVVVGTGGPLLSLSKTATPTAFVVGQPASYTITVRNSGSANTVGTIAVSDTLPAGITLQSYTGVNWTCTGTSTLSCSFSGTLAPSASTALVLNVLVGASTTSGNNTASVSGGGDPNCPQAASCTATVPVSVTQVSQSIAATPIDARWMLITLGLMLLGVGVRRRAR